MFTSLTLTACRKELFSFTLQGLLKKRKKKKISAFLS